MTWLRHKSHKVNDASCSSSAGGSNNFLIIDVSEAACEEAALRSASFTAALNPSLSSPARAGLPLPFPGCTRALVFTVNTAMCCDDARAGESYLACRGKRGPQLPRAAPDGDVHKPSCCWGARRDDIGPPVIQGIFLIPSCCSATEMRSVVLGWLF